MTVAKYNQHKGEVDSILARIKNCEAVSGYMLLSHDGFSEIADLPKTAHTETFAIMTATTYGAAITMNSEINRATPNYVKIVSDNGLTLATEAGNYILAVTLEKDLEKTISDVLKMAKEISEIIPA